MPLISLTGFITGIVFTNQSRPSLAQFGATSWLSGLISIAIMRALAPLVTALIAAGRLTSFMTMSNTPPSTDLFGRIADTIAGQGIVRSAVITSHSSFVDWQYKPVDLRELRCLLEKEFGVTIPDEALLTWQGPPDVLAYLSRPGYTA